MGDSPASRALGPPHPAHGALLPTGSFTVGWFRSTAASPAAWATAIALATLAPAASILTAHGSLVLRDVHSAQPHVDLTWLGSVAAILAVLFWIPKASGLRDALGRGRQWVEGAHLVVSAGTLGAVLVHVWSLPLVGTVSVARLADHAGAVLHVSGLAMLAQSLPLSRRTPAWTFLGAIGCAGMMPSSILATVVGLGANTGASQIGTWLIVGGLWVASVPFLRRN